jgi:hypothetical protein
MQRGHGFNVDVGFGSNGALTTQGGLDASVFGGETAARGLFLGPRLATQVGRHVRLSLEPRFSRYTVRQQYVDTLEGGRAETYGQRYVFAELQRRELSLRLRANVFFTPDLSLEGYAEPFASRGRYAAFGELERPRARTLRRYGTDGTTLQRLPDGSLEVTDAATPEAGAFVLEDPDFNLRSFRSNLVLRWEWRRGSSLFVVYQQDRFTGEAAGRAASPVRALRSAAAAGRTPRPLRPAPRGRSPATPPR